MMLWIFVGQNEKVCRMIKSGKLRNQRNDF